MRRKNRSDPATRLMMKVLGGRLIEGDSKSTFDGENFKDMNVRRAYQR